MRISKMCKTVIFLLQTVLTSNFVPDCQTVLKSCKNQGLLQKFSCSIRYKTCVSEIYDSYFLTSNRFYRLFCLL